MGAAVEEDDGWTKGAFFLNESGAGSPAGFADYRVGFDASRCSSIYGNSTTVQPPAYNGPMNSDQ